MNVSIKNIFKPYYIYFGSCPVCGNTYPHGVRVIKLLSNIKKGKYVVWCNIKHKFEKLYKEN